MNKGGRYDFNVALRDYDDAERVPLRKRQAMKGRSYRRESKTPKVVRVDGDKKGQPRDTSSPAKQPGGVAVVKPILKSSAPMRGAVVSGVRVMSGNHGRGLIRRGADNGK